MNAPVRIDFTHTPTCFEAWESHAFVKGLRGPVGSGKSSTGASFIMGGALSQPPAPDGIRHTRWAVIRNTAPELKSTTIPTFVSWFPEGAHGRVVYSSPITYHIRIAKTEQRPGIDCEILFIALDSPSDVRKLLSLELTGAWVNEAREVQKAIVDVLTGRVGRFPPAAWGESLPPQILMDTNSMDEDHWWYKAFEVNPPTDTVIVDGQAVNISWQHFSQPPAVLEVTESTEGRMTSIEPGYPGEFDKAECIPAAGRWWAVNPAAENLPNLRTGYYHQQLANKTLEWIQCYLQNKYIYVADGQPVVPEYIPAQMGGDWPILEGVPLTVGIDAGSGTLSPAAIILQRSPFGTWIAQSEIAPDDRIGIDRFTDMVMQHIGETYPGHEVLNCWADPAAEAKDEVFEQKIMDYLRAAGLPARAAPTQDPRVRADAIRKPCGRLIAGKPGLLVNKHRCPKLHKGLSGSWHYRRLQVAGTEKYEAKPDKGPYSHPCDALSYALCGGGEARVPRAAQANVRGTRQAEVVFDVFA